MTLADIAEKGPPGARVSAAIALLDRAYGSPNGILRMSKTRFICARKSWHVDHRGEIRQRRAVIGMVLAYRQPLPYLTAPMARHPRLAPRIPKPLNGPST